MRVLAIPGSLRRDSHNAALLRHLAEQAPAGVEVEIWYGLRDIPHYDEDIDNLLGPETVQQLRAKVTEADAILIATPEYNSSIPGSLKNTIDWLSRPMGKGALAGKPAAVIGASTGRFGAVWAQAEARKVLAATGSRVVSESFALGRAQEAFDDRGAMIDPAQSEQAVRVLEDLASEVETDRRLADQRLAA